MTNTERKARNNAYMKSYYARNKDKWREGVMRRDFGITVAKYDEMLASQNGRCAVCFTDTPDGKGRFHVDHCHSTSKVRGLLCHRCNTGLGLFRDSPDALSRAVEYLKA